MAQIRYNPADLDRWILNGRSWIDEFGTKPEPDEDDDYAYLDEDDCDDDPRYEDMICFPEDYSYDEY